MHKGEIKILLFYITSYMHSHTDLYLLLPEFDRVSRNKKSRETGDVTLIFI